MKRISGSAMNVAREHEIGGDSRPLAVPQPRGEAGLSLDIRSQFPRSILEMAVEKVFPVWKVVISPEKYPTYWGGLNGFDITALPKVFNPIIAAQGPKGFELLWDVFIDGAYVGPHQPASDGYIYREFHTFDTGKSRQIITLAELEPDRSPSWNQVSPHWTLGYLGIRKKQPEEEKLEVKLGVPIADLNPGNRRHYALFHLYRQLDVEEQGLSTNLIVENAKFLPGCKMYRLSITKFLRDFPFGTKSPLILDWDYGHTPAVAPARDAGHVDIKLNPLWLDWKKPWERWMQTIDGNFYRDLLNDLLRTCRDLWEPVPPSPPRPLIKG